MARALLLGRLHFPGGLEELKFATIKPVPPLDEARLMRVRKTLVSFFRWGVGPHPDADSEDLAQEVLARLALAHQEGKIRESLESYALGIARKVRADALTAKARQIDFSQVPLPSPPSLVETENLQRIEHCLDRLKPTDRKLILEYYSQDQHAKVELHRAMGKGLGLSAGALRGRIHRILESVRKCVRSSDDSAGKP